MKTESGVRKKSLTRGVFLGRPYKTYCYLRKSTERTHTGKERQNTASWREYILFPFTAVGPQSAAGWQVDSTQSVKQTDLYFIYSNYFFLAKKRKKEKNISVFCLCFFGPVDLNCRWEMSFKRGTFVRYPYDPGQAENQCLQGEHVFHLHNLSM